MVASSVVVPVVPPVTRLPADTRRSPMRPDTGARSSVNSRSSAAWRTAASCAFTDGLGDALGLRALIEGLLGDDGAAHQALARARGRLRRTRDWRAACARLACAWASAASNGRRSMVNSRSPFFTSLAVLEVDGVEVARHARAHLDGVDGDEAADVLVLVGDHAFGGLGDRHLRRRRRGPRGIGLARLATREREREQGERRRNAERSARQCLRHGISGWD